MNYNKPTILNGVNASAAIQLNDNPTKTTPNLDSVINKRSASGAYESDE